MTELGTLNLLKLCIEHKREIMINAANIYGFNDKVTIQHSQELDKLLNEYRKVVLGIREETPKQ